MEFDEQEEHEEEMEIPEPPSYDSFGNRPKLGGAVRTEGAASTIGRKSGTTATNTTGMVRYRECQKNHAVSFGGHAVDGCCEFIPAGEEGTLEAVICAACNCHRNFHRKEIDGEMSSFQRPQPLPPQLHQHHQFSPYYHRGPPYPSASGYLHHHLVTHPAAQQHRPLALPAAASGEGLSREEDDMPNPSSSGGGGGMKKRFRTKFTQEQKEKMLAFAEQVGWRIQKHDEAAVEQFCVENCVKRKVLKVWMHNNKNSLGPHHFSPHPGHPST